MEEKYRAIVVKATDYRENDKIVTLFTLEKGIVCACLKGVKKPNAKLKFASELFCFGEFNIVEKNGKRTITEVTQFDNFYSIRLDSNSFFAASAIMEFVLNFMLKEMISPELFSFVILTLTRLKEGVNPVTGLVYFYANALSLAGYEMDFSKCSRCGCGIKDRAFFNFEENNVVCQNDATYADTEIRYSTYSFIKKIYLSPTLSDDFNTNEYDLETAKFALKFFNYFLCSKLNVEIKSNSFLL